MAWGSVGTLGATSDKTAGTSIVHTTTATAEVGNVVVVVVAKDNAATADGNTSEVTSVTDLAGNTYTKAREFCNANGAADAGATVAIYYTVVTTQLASGGTITANFSDSRTASGLSAWEFTIGAGSTLSVAGSADLANDIADPGSMTISGLPSLEYLFVRGIASERDTTTALTVTTSYTDFTQAVTAGSTFDTNVGVRGEFRILTGTGDTSDPTLFGADHASTFVALREAPPAASSVPNSLALLGAGT